MRALSALAFVLVVACDRPSQSAPLSASSSSVETPVTTSATASAPNVPVRATTVVDAATLPKCTLVYSCGLSHPGLGSSSRSTSIDFATCARNRATSSGPWHDEPSPAGSSQTKTTSTKSVLAPTDCEHLKDLVTSLTQADARAAQESAHIDSEACTLQLTCAGDASARLTVQRQTRTGPTRVEQVINAM